MNAITNEQSVEIRVAALMGAIENQLRAKLRKALVARTAEGALPLEPRVFGTLSGQASAMTVRVLCRRESTNAKLLKSDSMEQSLNATDTDVGAIDPIVLDCSAIDLHQDVDAWFLDVSACLTGTGKFAPTKDTVRTKARQLATIRGVVGHYLISPDATCPDFEVYIRQPGEVSDGSTP